MTIHEVAYQLHDISVAGYFNGEKFTKRELEHYLHNAFRPELNTSRWVMEISLPDGRWFFMINRYSDKPDGFDYTIPDTREQEAKIKALLLQ